MKVVIVVALLLACANASVIETIQKLTASFATPYVIKGQEAEPNSAPYIVSLSRKFSKHSHTCGGTIINKEWIVTAAHCISKPVGMGVYAGLHERLQTNVATAQHREVDFGKVHSSYEGNVGPYDIALLHVSEPFDFNESVQPAVLPGFGDIPSGNATLYGWGQTKAYILTAAKTLQTVKTEVVDWDECKDTLPESAPLDPSNVCSSSLGKGVSACNGDSGGPLVKETENSPTELIGIVSWGYIPCGSGNMPSIYTRVSAYIGWMNDIQSAYYKLF
ncbi:lectizyme [Episyrphus balteatus]|uniref:lectizyme n=1 Tax=Episyrphus balteatus TaxID=286459 RepID=UPI0024863F4F|nr:lectizyme [Episyrphus balteatus]